MNRKTSVYEVRTEGDRQLLEAMLHRNKSLLVGSGLDADGTVFIRVRVAGDGEALEAALAACDGRTFTLVTGYGVNRRELALLRLDSGGGPA